MPLAKSTKYNSQTDMVAGRTASQIESAKRKAVGGKRKKCTKGKSCSATCIAINKVCMVEIPWVAAQALPKVVALVNKITSKRSPEGIPKTAPSKEKEQAFAKQEYDIKASTMLDNMRGAIKNDDKPTYDFFKKKITELHAKATSDGVEVGPLKVPAWKDNTPSVTTPEPRTTNKPTKPTTGNTDKKVDSQGRPITYTPLKELPGFVSATGTAPPMPSIKTEDDFDKVMSDTDHSKDPKHPYWKLDSFHERLGKVLVAGSILTPEQRDIANKMGGDWEFRYGVTNARNFTAPDVHYTNMRSAQRANAEGKTLSKSQKLNLEMADSVEKLISLLPKERVVKFRGAPASQERLDATIAASKAKETHSEGALTSWSTKLEVAKNFADNAPFGTQRIIYVTVNKRGATVRPISKVRYEEEIITPGSTRFQHTGRHEVVEVSGVKYNIFYMEEK